MFDIAFSINCTSDNISGFDLGHIRVLSDSNIISSCGRVPDQSIMVFPTIVDMLDGVRDFLKDKNVKEYRLICADSSFSIVFIKKRDGEVNIAVDDKIISEIDEKLFIKQIYNSCNNFFLQCKSKMLKNDPLIEDVEMALNAYKVSFNI